MVQRVTRPQSHENRPDSAIVSTVVKGLNTSRPAPAGVRAGDFFAEKKNLAVLTPFVRKGTFCNKILL